MDTNGRRLKGLPATASQQGVPAGFLTVSTADVRDLPGQQHAPFDRVLLDVPCSGLGVLAKRADLRWRRQPADILNNALLQVCLLLTVMAFLTGHCSIFSIAASVVQTLSELLRINLLKSFGVCSSKYAGDWSSSWLCCR